MIRQLDLCTDEDGSEAIYVNGVLEETFDTMYGCDVAIASRGEPVLVRHHNAEGVSDWPTKLSDVKLIVETPTLFPED